jgi:transposase-like protein
MNTISKEDVYYKTTQKQIQNFNQKQTPKTTCPYCQSTNCKKISGLSKAGSVALWGIFALGKTTKQWHCNNCKSDF